MATLIAFTDSIGKTITATTTGNGGRTCIIAFDDDTFTVIEAIGGGSESWSELSFEEPFNSFDFGDEKLVAVGIYSWDEIKALRDAQSAKFKALQEESELRQLQRLLKKHGLHDLPQNQ